MAARRRSVACIQPSRMAANRSQRGHIILLSILLLSYLGECFVYPRNNRYAWQNAVPLPLRGGGSSDENHSLDAYIEDFFDKAADTSESNSGGEGTGNSLSSDHETLGVTSGCDNEDDEPLSAPILDVTAVSSPKSDKELQDQDVEDEDSSDRNWSTTAVVTDDTQHSDATLSVREDEEHVLPTNERRSENRAKMSERDTDRNDAIGENQSSSSDVADRKANKPIRIPNPIFRLLLRQGRVGHIVVMTSVMSEQWIEEWIKPLARLLTKLFTFLFPVRMAVDRGPRRGRGSTHGGSSRSGMSSKESKKLVKKADEIALRQLKQLGSVSEAKYQHVSRAFLQRHGLGRYGKSEKLRLQENEDSGVFDNSDWVVNALTEEKKTKKFGGGISIKPTISVGIGSDGPDVSVGIDIGRRGNIDESKKKAIISAVSKPKKKRRKSVAIGPRASDSKGGDGFLGHLRTLSGANSQMSRTLFGAYPGDAPSVEEAGSRDGLIDVAHKYGYGEWSESEDAHNGNERSRRRRKRSSRGKSREDVGASMDRNGGSVIGPRKKTRRVHREPPLSSSSTLRETVRRGPSKTSLDSEAMPSLSRSKTLNEGRGSTSVMHSASEKLEGLKRRQRRSGDQD